MRCTAISAPATFQPFRGCETPKSYGLVNGRHIFKVKATDGAGNTDPTPAVYGFKILRG